MKFRKSYCFDDVLLVPKYSDICSRKEVSIDSSLSNRVTLNIPIISSPMDTITESVMATEMNNLGGLGIIHRYNTIEEQASMVSNVEGIHAAAAIGVSGDYLERASSLIDAGANLLCIDVAHGHHSMMRHALKTLRNTFGYDIHIMAGNVATLDGFNDLADWGADSIRVGIGGGSICSTRIQTGHGMPTLQSIIDCSYSDRDATLIADGGIRNSGDITKALAAGADAVMLGSLLSGTNETPGDILFDDSGKKCKAYRGMASVEAQIDWRGHASSVEGVSSVVSTKGSVSNVVGGLVTGIKSGLSYTGSKTIKSFQSSAEFVSQTSAGSIESSTHISKN